MTLQLAMTAVAGLVAGASITAFVLARRLRRDSRALSESERRYRTLFESAPISIWEEDFSAVGVFLDRLRKDGVTDLRGWFANHPEAVLDAVRRIRVLDVNEITVRMWEAGSKAELVQKLPSLFIESAIPVFTDELISLANEQAFFAGVVHGQTCKGNRLDVLMTWSAPKREGRIDPSRVLVGFVDISDLVQTRGELDAERERLAVTLESVNEAVLSVGADRRVIAINPAAARLIGTDTFDALGHPFSEVLPLRIDAPGTDPVEAVLSGGPPIEMTRGCRMVRADGTDRDLELVVAPMIGRAAHHRGAVLVARDVTERRRMEREAINASKLESIALLAGGIAHDFNNLLTAMTNGIYLMHVAGVPETAGEALREMERAVTRARDITRQLLVFSRGGAPLKELADIAPIIREAAEFAVVGSNVDVTFDLPEKLWPGDVDRTQIAQAVQNIVLNARQAMPTGGVVHLTARNDPRGPEAKLPPGPYVRVSIQDNGPGMTADIVARVFEPFFTTKPKSTGIGLTAAQSIMHRHGGLLEARSQPGSGAEFVFWLPAGIGSVDRSSVVEVPSITDSGRILFVEDEEPVRVLAVRVLRSIGYQVQPARNSAEAVRLYQRAAEQGSPFDVVITDLTMRGGMGGVETLKELRLLDPKARVIVSSGYADDPVMASYRSHGFDGAVEKPYEIPRLAAAIRAVMRREPRTHADPEESR